jgi:hypothetical protein
MATHPVYAIYEGHGGEPRAHDWDGGNLPA